ncbi:hypothetical protein Tco_1538101 [Tanacetum coccineum]
MRKKERVLMEEKYLAASQRIKSICNDEDDSIPLRDIIARYSLSVAITSSPPGLPTREPEDSLIMGDEHLNTIPEKESDELIKSSVENLVPIPSKSEVTFDNESECDMPVCDDFTTFSNPLFDSNDDFTASDDESLYSSDDESLSDEDRKKIRLVENLLYDNSSPRPRQECNSENVDTIIESPSPSLILVEDSDSLMEEIDLFLASDDSMPPGIENDDYDSEGDICFLEELLSNDCPSPSRK